MWRSVKTPISACGGLRVYTSDQKAWSAERSVERVGGCADVAVAVGDVGGGEVEGGG